MGTTPERRLAIALTAPFRKSLDRHLSPVLESNKILNVEIEEYIRDNFGVEPSLLPAKLVEAMKTVITTINSSLYEHQSSAYNDILVKEVEGVMTSLENHFLSEYSDDELKFLADIVNDERLQRLLNDDPILSILLNGYGKVSESLGDSMLEFLMSKERFMTEEMKKLLSSDSEEQE